MELLFSHALKLCLRKNKTKKLLKMIKIDFSTIILCSLNKNKNFQVLEEKLFSKDPLFTVVAMPGLGGGGKGGGARRRGVQCMCMFCPHLSFAPPGIKYTPR